MASANFRPSSSDRVETIRQFTWCSWITKWLENARVLPQSTDDDDDHMPFVDELELLCNPRHANDGIMTIEHTIDKYEKRFSTLEDFEGHAKTNG